MSDYLTIKEAGDLPRLPLEGSVDLTYRCNNSCLHCWLWKPARAREQRDELTFDEIHRIADEARILGTQRWNISGGEPMLRPDFPEIFDYLTRRARGYSLNTNGTLITPDIAQLLARKGAKMIALYGATAEVYDAVTRNPGGFETMMRGLAYLREAGAGFIVQLIPMRANRHQWDRMVALARSLSPHWRVGAPWLFLSADGSPQKNRRIAEQRLSPRAVIELDRPDLTYGEWMEETEACGVASHPVGGGERLDDRLFAGCIAGLSSFHIDPFGRMTFCSFIKDPALRYDLRCGTFRQAWEEFIPSLANRVHGGDEWRENCGSCEKSADCNACGAYAYLETGRYSARIPYLCAIADETRKFKAGWPGRHRRYFQIAGITVRVESDMDLDAVTFNEALLPFSVAGPGDDNVTLRHYFELPDLKGKDMGEELYRQVPWAISHWNGTWFYRGISTHNDDSQPHRVAVFTAEHTHAAIYSPPGQEARIRSHGWPSLSLFPSDQIWLAPLLADRRAVLLHSSAVILNGRGLVFAGHSDAGKSTIAAMLKDCAEILCDDRNVVRHWLSSRSGAGEDRRGQWRVHGTWSHGDVADVSAASAPLRAILFLQQASHNAIVPLTDRKEIWRCLLAVLIKPMVTAEWWQKELNVLEQIVDEVPCYTMHFDRSGAIVETLVRL